MVITFSTVSQKLTWSRANKKTLQPTRKGLAIERVPLKHFFVFVEKSTRQRYELFLNWQWKYNKKQNPETCIAGTTGYYNTKVGHF